MYIPNFDTILKNSEKSKPLMNETEKQNNLFLSFLQQLILGFIYMSLGIDERQQYWQRYISSDHR